MNDCEKCIFFAEEAVIKCANAEIAYANSSIDGRCKSFIDKSRKEELTEDDFIRAFLLTSDRIIYPE